MRVLQQLEEKLNRTDSAPNTVQPKSVLMVAYHFPPQVGSSGHLRTLKYSTYLPQYGWKPTVLSVHPRAYERVDESHTHGLPSNVKVVRAFALDTRKHLSFRKRYLRHSALPDRWVTWCLGAVPQGLFTMYREKTEVIFTTFPIASAMLIGYLLNRITGVPWVADFRDPMTEDNYPTDARTRKVLRWLEKKVACHASRLIFTSASTMRRYQQRYRELLDGKCQVIANGYDEHDFAGLARAGLAPRDRVRMQHSGLIYPEERNPIPFFRALSRLKQEGTVDCSWFSLDLRACGEVDRYKQIIEKLDIQDLVHFPPALPYRQALEDSSQSDALLLLQGASCDAQIPAKTYEYLRLGKPILALTTQSGDTANVLKECGGASIVDIGDEEIIYKSLPGFLYRVRAGSHPLPEMSRVAKYSRQSQAEELARCLSAAAEPIANEAENAELTASAAMPEQH